ncbi:MAG TPA: TonB-dependent receptor, partial [Polyangiales bacterium]|nr:TonB-dependent receptor [Polyangiales bacterium]
MKQRIDAVTMLCVLALSAPAFAQAPEPEPEGPAEGPIDEGPLGEADEGPVEAAPDPSAEPSEPAPAPEAEAGAAAGVEGEAGGEVGGEIGGDVSAPVVEEAPPVAPPSASQDEEIVVTGSRIKRSTAFSSSAPVDVIDRKQLEYSGATNLADVVQHLSATGANGFRGQGAGAGAVGVNLRGLGFQATLVLVNGRRMSPSGAGVTFAFSDLGVIPLSAVERIEVLKGGGSAIYGSDAVAGVVNIITRKNFDGVRLEADGQTTEEFDQREGTVSAAFGANSERGRVMTSVSYFRSNELTADERDFSKGKYVSTQGNPASFVLGTGTVVDPACTTVRGSFVVPGASGPLCGWDYRQYTSFLGGAERAAAFASAEYDVTNHTTLFAELNVSRLRGYAVTSPSFGFPPPFPTIPADHVDNPFGSQVSFIGRPIGTGHVNNTADDDTLRVVAGIKGDLEGAAADTLLESWEWELYTMMGVSRYRGLVHDNLRDSFQLALNSCSDPADLSRCFNPFYSSLDGTGTPNSDKVIESFASAQETLTEHALQTYNAGISGSLFELPGGELGLALGGEVRNEFRWTEVDHDGNLNRYGFLLGNSDARADRKVYSGYLELRWPFYDGIEVQTAGRVEHYTSIGKSALSPSAGITITPGEIAGRDNVPAGFRRLQLRGQITKAFRSPTLYQEFPGRATLPVALQIPGSPLPVFTPVVISGNPDLDPESALVFSAGVMWQVVDELSFLAEYWNYDYTKRIIADSGQQIINSWAAGGMTDPRVVVDAAGRVIRVEGSQKNAVGSVATHGLDFGLNIALTGATFGGGKDDFGTISFGGNGNYTLGYTIPRAESGARLLAAIPAQNGNPAVPAMALPPADCDGSKPSSSCEISGKRNATTIGAQTPTGGGALPKLRVNFPLTWSYSGHTAAFMTHYIDGL